MTDSPELALYTSELQRLLRRLSEAVDGLDEAALNWRPPAPDANSAYVIATHTMGNLEAWVLGIACSRPVERDRPAEFVSSGADSAPLVARAHDLAQRFEEALRALPPSALDETREPNQAHWGIGRTAPVTVRQALMHAIEHAATHVGHLDVTLDLARSPERSKA